MRLTRHLLGGLLGLALCAGTLRADTLPSPLRLIPQEAELVIQAKAPRQLMETVTSLDYVKQLLAFDIVKEFLDSTQARRFNQMVAYFEKELGVSRLELMDRVGGGGAALAARLGDNAPVLLVLQSTDEKLLRKFVQLALVVVDQELARQGSKDHPVKGTYQNVETVRIGKGFHGAIVQGALLVSNNEKALQRGLDLAAGREKKSMAGHAGLIEAATILPRDPLVSVWVDMIPVRKAPGADALYKKPRDPVLTVILGGWADVAVRAPYLCAALCRADKGLLLTVRMPRGQEGMGPEKALVCAPAGEAGTRPLLEPKDVLLSDTFYLDVSKFWTERGKLFGDKQVKTFEAFDKNSGRFLSNIQVSKLLTWAGARHRFVATRQPRAGYQKQPKTPLPAFALIVECRKPDEFAKAMEGVLRGAALFGGSQARLKLAEEKYKDCNIVGYRFDEKRPLKQDVNDLRFNFSPCFAKVAGQFIFCSTIELGRELIDLLQAEAKGPSKFVGCGGQARLYARGGVALLKSFEDQLVTQTILNQALPLEQARAQVKRFLDLLGKADGVTLETTYAPKEFHYDIRFLFSR